MRLLNRTTQKIRFFRGNATGINSNLNILGLEGEPLYATDSKQLYIHDGNIYSVVPTAQKIVMNNDEVVSYNDELIWIN